MPRQTFISKDFFVNASEKTARQLLFSIPGFFPGIRFIEENNRLHSARFFYEKNKNKPPAYIDISLLPLNENQTKISLHGSYVNGAVFYKDEFMLNALNNFESAIYAALNGNLSEFEPRAPKKNTQQKMLSPFNAMFTYFGPFLFWRRKIG